MLQPPYVCEETIDADKLATAIRGHFTAFDLIEGEAEVALALRWLGAPSYERIAAFARGHRARPAADHRAARSRSTSCSTATSRRRSARSCARNCDVESEILCIDGVVLWDFDYIDLGRIRLPSMTVPVTIKSLVFSEDPRRPPGASDHPSPPRDEDGHSRHDHDHDHGHDHHHGHTHGHEAALPRRPGAKLTDDGAGCPCRTMTDSCHA